MMGLVQQQPGEGQHHGADREDGDEGRAPAEPDIQVAAQVGRDHRRHHHNHGDVADHAGGFLAAVGVAHDGAPQYQPGAAADRLHDAADNQQQDGIGQRRHQAAGQEHHHAAQQHRAAAEAVGQRAHEQLRHGDPGEIERQGQLDGAVVGGEDVDHAGHGGNEDVERHRAQRGQRDEDRQRRTPGGGTWGASAVGGGVVSRAAGGGSVPWAAGGGSAT